MLKVNDAITVPEDEIILEFIRASGPGGQNVNKVSTAVQLRFDVRHSPSLPPYVRERLERLAGSRLTRQGVVVINAQRHRTQLRNRADALERLADLIREAAHVDAPRRPTKPSRSSKRKRIDSKVRRGAVKSLRARPGRHD